MGSKNMYHYVAFWLKYLYKIICLKLVTFFDNTGCKSQELCEFKDKLNNTDYIPKVKGLPLVGTIFDLIAAGGAPKLHLYIDKRHAEYGHIFRECLGGTEEGIFVSSANLMRAVFIYEGSYPRHPLPEAWVLYNKENNCQRGLFFMDGEEWFHNRRILSRLLLNGNLDWMDWHVRQQSNRLIQKWLRNSEAQSSKGFIIENLEEQLYRWSIDVIISVMFGETSDLEILDIQQAVDEFSNIVHKIFETSSPLMNFPPRLAKILGMKIWREFEKSVEEVLIKGYHVIDLFLERTSAYPGGLYEKLQEAEVPLDMIKRIFVDLVIAAGDTTAYSTTWALYLLSQDEKLQEKLHEEYNTNTHDTPLLRGLIKETLRLYPVAPFIGRYIAQECRLDNKYHLKENSLVFLSLFTAGRDAKHFPEPLKVMPERWLRNEQTGELRAVYAAHATLPFAIGNRSCIGRKLAINQMQYMIAAMAKLFHLKCINNAPIESVLRLVTVPNQPIKLLINKRWD
ncbi:Cytochrome P450 315a1, mitochondrial [Lucilia cuprina]|uniref:Cytochrome P450 315a1, mitochondrial n=1 Tax=Lucilia cuprina TaxID=7375 RepID=A0A0L0CBJ1_LUCCU|nr:mitochondrial, Cytochrome P450 315a1 [Lucilia cuprina]KNC29778.1 Cytochrome P450 315a1, mitochondrial [Lucilia cuprina]